MGTEGWEVENAKWKLGSDSHIRWRKRCKCTLVVEYGMAQYGTIQYSTVQYSTVQYSTVRYNTTQHNNNTTQHNTTQHNTRHHDESIPMRSPISSLASMAYLAVSFTEDTKRGTGKYVWSMTNLCTCGTSWKSIRTASNIYDDRNWNIMTENKT